MSLAPKLMLSGESADRSSVFRLCLGVHSGCIFSCDHCQLCYHFACLDPPCKRSPKVRGYEWVCSICQSDDNEDSETRQVDFLAVSD